MKRKQILIFLLLLMTLPASMLFSVKAADKDDTAVKRPDLEQIRQAVTDYDGPFYYPKLRKLYAKNDTVMTPEQYRYFYLGALFQEDFNPYRVSEFSVDVDSLSFKLKHTPQECDSIMSRAELALADNPFDLRQMSFLIYALKEKKKDMRAKIWQYRLENILNTIKNTGTGEDAENAWYVVSPDHEYALINAMNYTATGYDDNTPGIDYIQVVPNVPKGQHVRGKIHEGFYFNVKNLQEEYDRKFGDEEVPEKQPAAEEEEEIDDYTPAVE